MEKIYEVKGSVNKGFIGQISYSVNLEKTYESLDIALYFNKQRITDVTPELKEEVKELVFRKYGVSYKDEAELEDAVRGMKTEIHMVAYLNDIFIGGVHRQLKERHMIISKDNATEGCIPQENIEGVLKVTVLVFNVLYDDTCYELKVYGKERVEC